MLLLLVLLLLLLLLLELRVSWVHWVSILGHVVDIVGHGNTGLEYWARPLLRSLCWQLSLDKNAGATSSTA